ncbi:PIN domain-containing protein [Athalassotoga saccharophila]|uniref:PIN domain-containing protein n=1 Tax=Athalassotoga saccharophila TaxID=1441386 RepID=A0A6N4TEC4_9BACT|nr:hypothetical protein [Athalassotoga saccharophila]BBJ29087.1 hypothetical protein ATHSA_p10040 [Athalassotoga saccharophila]
MQEIIIDSNVVISAGIGSDTCTQVILYAADLKIVSPKIQIKELNGFLEKEETILSPKAIIYLRGFFEFYESIVNFEDPKRLYGFSEDPSDDAFISLAYEENGILISGDREVLTLSKPYVKSFSPREYLDFIGYYRQEK